MLSKYMQPSNWTLTPNKLDEAISQTGRRRHLGWMVVNWQSQRGLARRMQLAQRRWPAAGQGQRLQSGQRRCASCILLA
ncbi:hypothetical protein, partial [Xanthomonas vesicatoria]|uniref:hypothetical protein n=1 Tax=Xanthomonas vesicatoria TaxID=56460 RepID=UPI001C12AE6E